jgi:hypothetical protein
MSCQGPEVLIDSSATSIVVARRIERGVSVRGEESALSHSHGSRYVDEHMGERVLWRVYTLVRRRTKNTSGAAETK